LSKKKQKPAVAANKMRRSYFKPGNWKVKELEVGKSPKKSNKQSESEDFIAYFS
jgi:hypothetical protein